MILITTKAKLINLRQIYSICPIVCSISQLCVFSNKRQIICLTCEILCLLKVNDDSSPKFCWKVNNKDTKLEKCINSLVRIKDVFHQKLNYLPIQETSVTALTQRVIFTPWLCRVTGDLVLARITMSQTSSLPHHHSLGWYPIVPPSYSWLYPPQEDGKWRILSTFSLGMGMSPSCLSSCAVSPDQIPQPCLVLSVLQQTHLEHKCSGDPVTMPSQDNMCPHMASLLYLQDNPQSIPRGVSVTCQVEQGPLCAPHRQKRNQNKNICYFPSSESRWTRKYNQNI